MTFRFTFIAWLVFFCLPIPTLLAQDRPFIPIYSGMEIAGDILFVPGKYVIDTATWSPIIVEGENIDLNFNDAQLIGCPDSALPHQYTKTAIICRNAKNITLRNLRIARFQTAIRLENCENVRIENCDISYMHRTMWMQETSTDTAFETSRLLPSDAAVRIENCSDVQLMNNYFNANMNSIQIAHTREILLFNNFFLFNGGKPIAVESCQNLNALNNRFDFNFGMIAPSSLAGPTAQSAIEVDGLSGDSKIAYNGFSIGDAALSIRNTNSPIVLQGNTMEHMRYAAIILDNSNAQLFSNQMDSCRHGMLISGPCHLEMGGNFIKNVDQALFIVRPSKESRLLAACNVFQGIGSLISLDKSAKLKKKLSISFQENHIAAKQLSDPAWDKRIAPYFSENVFYQAAPERCKIKRSVLWPGSFSRKNSLSQNYPENLTDSILSLPCQALFPNYQLIPVPANAMSTSTGLYQGKTRRDMKSGVFGPYDYRYPYVLPIWQTMAFSGFEVLGPTAMSYTLTSPHTLGAFSTSGLIPDTVMPVIAPAKTGVIQAELKTYGQNSRLPNGQFIGDQDTITQSYFYMIPTNGYRLTCLFLLSKKNLEWTFVHWSGLPWEEIRAQNNEPCECVIQATFETPAYPGEMVFQGNIECAIRVAEKAADEFHTQADRIWTKRLSLKTDQPNFELQLKFKPDPTGNYLGFRWLIKE